MAGIAYTPALKLTKRFQSELILIRVVGPLAKSPCSGLAFITAIKAAEKALLIQATEFLESITIEINGNCLQVLLTIFLQMVVIYWSFFQNLFKTDDLSAVELLLSLFHSMVVFWGVRQEKSAMQWGVGYP